MLLTRNDAGFYDSRTGGIRDEGGGGNFLAREEFAEFFRMGVGPNETAQVNLRAEGAEVAGDIRRAAGVAGFFLDFHDRHRGLGRNAGDFAPDEFVEHDIPDHEEAAPFGGLKKML